MRFASVHMAVWLWVVPVIAVFLMVSAKARARAMRNFAQEAALSEIAASFDARKRRLRDFLVLSAFLFMVLALMRPQWGFQWQEVKRQGIDIMIALDTSNSMLAEDVKPNRLERAKLAIKDLVKKLKGDRIGLIAFSGTAFLQCPMTLDYDGFLMSLYDLDTFTIPIGGTSLAKAIYKAIDSFDQTKKDQKILIVITDGEDLEGGLEKAIQQAKAKGVRIFCVGIGSPEGELIPIPDERGKQGFLRDEQGNVVRTKLNEAPLQKIAMETGGMYVRATGVEFGLDLMYQEELSKLQKEEFKAKMEKRYHERFQIPLAAAFFLLFLEPLIGDRKTRKFPRPSAARGGGFRIRKKKHRKRSQSAKALTAVIITQLLAVTVFALGETSKAARLYREEQYDEALEKYDKALERKPDDPALEYNKAVVLYQKGEMEKAQGYFLKASALGKDDIEKKAVYNVGNTKYRIGESFSQTSPDSALKIYAQAAEYYKRAIELDPEDMDAKYNYEFTLNKMRQMEDQKKDEQKKEDQKDQQDQEDKEDQKDQQDQQDKEDQKDQQDQEDKEDQKDQQDQEDKEDQKDQQDQQDKEDQKDQQDQEDKEDQKDQQDQEDKEDQKDQQDQEDKEDQKDQQDQQDKEDQKDQQDQQDKKDQDRQDKEQQERDNQEKEQQQDQQQEDQQSGGSDGQPGGYEQQPVPGQMTEQQAQLLLKGQEEEENRMRGEKKKAQRAQRPPVVRDW
jgi:Ca-activated chloride channel homolog